MKKKPITIRSLQKEIRRLNSSLDWNIKDTQRLLINLKQKDEIITILKANPVHHFTPFMIACEKSLDAMSHALKSINEFRERR